MTGRQPPPATASLTFLALITTALALFRASAQTLVPPPLTDPSRWASWLEGRGPIVAAFSLLRVGAIAVLGYLVVVILLGIALRAAGATSLVRLADRLTVGPVRRVLAGSVYLGLAASGVVAVAAPRATVPVAVAQVPVTTPPDPAPATVTMRRLEPAETPPPASASASVAARAPAAQLPAAGAARWTVRPGECFWSIAESVLAQSWGRAPTDAEIVPYWRRLIDANRHHLAQADDPDLIFPAQVFEIPAP